MLVHINHNYSLRKILFSTLSWGLLLIALLAITGCISTGKKKPSLKSDQSVTSPRAESNRSGLKPISDRDFDRDWITLFHCRGNDYWLKTTISANGRNLKMRLSGKPRLAGVASRGAYAIPDSIDGELIGTLDRQTGMLSLGSAQGTNKLPAMKGLFHRSSGQFSITMQGRLWQSCSQAVIVSTNRRKQLEDKLFNEDPAESSFAGRLLARFNRSHAQDRCEKPVQRWLRRYIDSLPEPYNARSDFTPWADVAFSDPEFKKAFKVRLNEYPVRAGTMLQHKLPREDLCGLNSQEAQQKWAAISKLVYPLTNNVNYSRNQTIINNVARNISEQWLAEAHATLKAMAGSQGSASIESLDKDGLSELRNAISFANLRQGPNQVNNLEPLLAEVDRRVTHKEAFLALDRELKNPDTSPDQLQRLAGFTGRHRSSINSLDPADRKQIDQRLRQHINQHLLNGARQDIARQQGVNGYRRLNTWPSRYSQALNMSSQSTRQQIDELLSRRKTVLLSELSTQYQRQFERDVNSKPPGIDALRAGVAIENRINGELGNLARLAPLKTLANQRQQRRARDLAAANDALLNEIKGLASVSALDNLRNRHLLGKDRQLPQARSIEVALEKRKKVLAPFSGKGDHRYLNAIYGGDFDLADRLDAEFVAPYKQAMSNDAMKAAGTLMNLFAKQAGFDIDYNKAMEKSFEAASLIVPVFAVYLIDYESVYGACLGRDAVRMKKTTTSETVYRDGYGNRTHSVKHPDVIEYFVIPGRFKTIFHDVGLTKPDSQLAQYIDGIFGRQGRINARDLVAATRKMMSDNACDSSLINRMERQMTYYFARYRGEKREAYEALFN